MALDRYGHELTPDMLEVDGIQWYNISDPIPVKDDDPRQYVPKGEPVYYIVRRGQYHIVPEWDYMDVLWVNEDCTKWYTSDVCRYMGKEPPHKFSERKFNNLVARLADPEVDFDRIRKSYL